MRIVEEKPAGQYPCEQCGRKENVKYYVFEPEEIEGGPHPDAAERFEAGQVKGTFCDFCRDEYLYD